MWPAAQLCSLCYAMLSPGLAAAGSEPHVDVMWLGVACVVGEGAHVQAHNIYSLFIRRLALGLRLLTLGVGVGAHLLAHSSSSAIAGNLLPKRGSGLPAHDLNSHFELIFDSHTHAPCLLQRPHSACCRCYVRPRQLGMLFVSQRAK